MRQTIREPIRSLSQPISTISIGGHVVCLATWCQEPGRLNPSEAKYKHEEKQNMESMESMCFHGNHSFNATMTRPNDQSHTEACKLHPLPIRRLYAAHGKFRLFILKFQVAFDNHVHQCYLYAYSSTALLLHSATPPPSTFLLLYWLTPLLPYSSILAYFSSMSLLCYPFSLLLYSSTPLLFYFSTSLLVLSCILYFFYSTQTPYTPLYANRSANSPSLSQAIRGYTPIYATIRRGYTRPIRQISS